MSASTVARITLPRSMLNWGEALGTGFLFVVLPAEDLALLQFNLSSRLRPRPNAMTHLFVRVNMIEFHVTL